MSRVTAIAAMTPIATPTLVRITPYRTKRRRTSACCAPSASRMPIAAGGYWRRYLNT